jgi:vancomycin resistance protein VanJ
LKAVVWQLCLAGVYGMILVAITVLNWMSADRFWLGALNLYLPQAMWAVPGIILTIFIFKAGRFWTWLPLLCVFWVLGPIMGYCWHLHAAKPAPGSLPVRVMTWNIKYGSYDIAPLMDEIARYAPDVVFFQDAVDSMSGPLGEYFKKWQVRSFGQFVIASRYPLSEAEVHELPASGEKKENFLRCQMRIGPAVVSLYNVHLKTPRRSLNAFRTARRQPWDLPEAIQTFDNNVRLRLVQAISVLGYLSGETGPVIVAGDLNAPDASLVCATLRDAGLHDAFAERGRGYGFTYGHFLFKHRLPWLRISWMRIDHIMVSSGFLTRRCFTGTGKASDHRPVIADLVLKYP